MRPAATVMTKIALAGIGLPVILVLLCYLSLSSGGADHNRAAVHLAFDGGDIPKGMSSDYLEYIRQMQKSFEELDAVLDHLDEMAEEGKIDRYLVKSVFLCSVFRRRPGFTFHRTLYAVCRLLCELRRADENGIP